MTLQTARDWLAANAPDLGIIETTDRTSTVAEAATALRVVPGRIAKSLALRVNGDVLLVVARGDARLDNQKSRAEFGGRPRMLDADETLLHTGHPVGGVCPFGLATAMPVYCDMSLRDYATVFPAAGSLHSSVEVTPARLAELVSTRWVDVCRLPD